MSVELTIGEVLRIAENIEREAAAFFRRAAGAAFSAPARKLLTELAEMEDEHVQVFEGLRIQMSAQDEPSGFFLPDSSERKALPVLAHGIIENIKADLAASFQDQAAREVILKRALDFEKDTVVFYTGVKEMLSSPSDKQRVDKLILEELRHVLTLTAGPLTSREWH